MGTPITGVYTYSTNRTILALEWGESIRHQPISDCCQVSDSEWFTGETPKWQSFTRGCDWGKLVFFWLRGSYKFWDDPRICLFMRFHGLPAFSDHFIMVFVSYLVNECALNTCRRHRSRVARKNLLCPLLFYCARKANNKTIKVTGNDGHELVWKAVASYLWLNVHPYLVDFYSDWPINSVVMITGAFLIYINCLKVVIIIWVPSWENSGFRPCILVTKMQVGICIHTVWMSDQHLI